MRQRLSANLFTKRLTLSVSRPLMLFLVTLLQSLFVQGLAQRNIMRSSSKVVKIEVDGKLTPVQWLISPTVEIDEFRTTGHVVSFISDNH